MGGKENLKLASLPVPMNPVYTVTFRSNQFPVLEGEDDEIVNPGTHGKALALYLQSKLEERGYSFQFLVCEDFGWWLEFKDSPTTLGIICSRDPMEEERILCGLSKGMGKYWSWRKFRYVDAAEFIRKLEGDLSRIIRAVEDVEVIDETFSDPPKGQ